MELTIRQSRISDREDGNLGVVILFETVRTVS